MAAMAAQGWRGTAVGQAAQLCDPFHGRRIFRAEAPRHNACMSKRRRLRPAYLRAPLWFGDARDEHTLPLPPTAYALYHEGDCTVVIAIESGEIFYDGPGPAVIVVPTL